MTDPWSICFPLPTCSLQNQVNASCENLVKGTYLGDGVVAEVTGVKGSFFLEVLQSHNTH